LSGRAGTDFCVEGVLHKSEDQLPAEIRSTVAEYRDLLEALQDSEYHRFRLTMKSCSILPPSRVLNRVLRESG
jgi:hypothetical protein